MEQKNNQQHSKKESNSKNTSPQKMDKSIYANQHDDAQEMTEHLHWAFTSAKATIAKHNEKEGYTCASGITPSGVVHIGNFREAITVDLVKRAFLILGKKARHIHSWDNYDVFRKVPKDMPNQELLNSKLRMSIVDVPDTFGKYSNYAEIHMKAVEETMPLVGIFPEYKYQAEKYRNCEYAEQIKFALEHTSEIKKILDEYREEPLEATWLPTSIFCDHCKKDTITKQEWKGNYEVYYECECGHSETFDFQKKGIIKLAWRIDWPMRWNVEHVDFEPGGKDHSTDGGSFTTAQKITREIWNREPPFYTMYDFISIKGGAGKMSSSAGGAITLATCLEVYQPEIVRFLFARTRPNAEFAISFDADVIKIYEDYDRCERIFFGIDQASEKDKLKNKWIYILSQVDNNTEHIPKEMPVQIPFRPITQTLCITQMNEEKTYETYKNAVKTKTDEMRLKARIHCARNWLEKYADENFMFKVNTEKDLSYIDSISNEQKVALSLLREAISEATTTDDLNAKIFEIPKTLGMKMPEFFALAYKAIINRERGPKLAAFIDEIGRVNVMKLL